MTIAELFVNLSVSGGNKAVEAIKGVKTTLEDTKEMSLATKAAIVAVIFAFERLTAAAGQRGTEMRQFASFTGLSTLRLQELQAAFRGVGVSGDVVTNSVKGVQDAMARMRLGMGPPGGMGMLARTVGFDETKSANTFYVMEKLRQFANSMKGHTAEGNVFLKSFGISDEMIAGWRSAEFHLKKLKPTEYFTSGEIATLDKVNIAWMKFWQNLKMFSDKLVADQGLNAVQTLANAFTFLTDVGHNIRELVKSMPEFQNLMVAAGFAITAAWSPITATVLGLITLLSELQKFKEGKESFIFGQKDKEGSSILYKARDFITKNRTDSIARQNSQLAEDLRSRGAYDELREMGLATKPHYEAKPIPSTVNIQQTLQFQHDGKDPKKTADSHNKAANKAMRGMQKVWVR